MLIKCFYQTVLSIPLGILKKVMEDLQVMVKELRFGKLHFYLFCIDCFDNGLELKNGMKNFKNITYSYKLIL